MGSESHIPLPLYEVLPLNEHSLYKSKLNPTKKDLRLQIFLLFLTSNALQTSTSVSKNKTVEWSE